ncbi:MAG: hypothetical protein Kow00107_09110 [Planctomycetota bacterium]
MNLPVRATFIIALLLAGIVSSAAEAEEKFPPGPRLKSHSAWWTSTSMLCDNTWSEIKIILENEKLDDDLLKTINAIRTECELARLNASRTLADSANIYYITRRGKVFIDRYSKYGHALKYKDTAAFQNTLMLVDEIGEMLAKGEFEGLEDLVVSRTITLTDALKLRASIEPEYRARYLEIAADLVGAVFDLVKVDPDLSKIRETYEKITKLAVPYALEFYCVSPSAVDIFIFRDGDGRQWIQFAPDPRSPFVGAEVTEGIELVTFEVDTEAVGKALADLSKADEGYKKATLSGVRKVIETVSGELKAKIEKAAADLLKEDAK